MRRRQVIAALSLALLSPAAHAFTITPTFTDGDTQTWTPTEEAVVNEAINDWTTQLSYVDPNQNIPITFDFTHAGNSYLGEWSGSFGNTTPVGISLNPWTPGAVDTIHINADLMVPRDPSTGDGYNVTLLFTQDPITDNNWDALSVVRHELGHALGFTTLYTDSNGNTSANKYEDLVSGSGSSVFFDQQDGGLNVPLDSSSDIVHVGIATDLMNPTLFNGTRNNISITDLQMLSLAYGYSVTITPGTTYSASTLDMAGLTVNGTLTLANSTGTRKTPLVLLNATSVTLGSAGLLDVGNHDLIVHAGLSLTDVKNLIAEGKGTGNWNGMHGITSSTAAATVGTALGFATADSIGVNVFDNVDVDPSDILIKYTFNGDANLDGAVNIQDLTILANHWQRTNATWATGDFDGNGIVDIQDLTIIANNWLQGNTSKTSLLMPALATLVPEPSSLLLASLAVPLLLKRRRHKV